MASFGMIPPELRALRQWVVWKTVIRDGNPTKPLYNARTGALARTHNQEGKEYKDRPEDTWSTFDEAVAGCRRGHFDGIGLVFTEKDPYVGIDIDDCVTRGVLSADARRILNLLGSYAEYSPSKSGLHILVRARLPEGGRRRGPVEMYERARYFTMTGDVLEGAPCEIQDRQAEVEQLHAMIFGEKPVIAVTRAHVTATDAEILDRARRAVNGGKFQALYDHGLTAMYGGDDSAADLALCDMLAFWTGPDEGRIDRLFRGSALMRPKWERRDYSARTITKALANRTEFYDPNRRGCLNGVNGKIGAVVREGGAPDGDAELLEQELRESESGSADRVLAAHAENLLHAYNENVWYCWSGNRWSARAEARALALVEQEMRALYDEARITADEERRKRLAKYALRTESNRYLRAVLDIMRRRTQIAVQPADFDVDRFALNCHNGTVDLRTGALRPHSRPDLISKLAGCSYVPDAPASQWLRFVERILPDPDVRSFVQRACGYALSGDVSEQCFFFLHGLGRNGKSVLLATLLSVLGEYATQAASELLLAKTGDRVRPELADLAGRRMVSTVEIDEGRRIAEGLVKQMTGGDRMKARFLYQNEFEFAPTHKVFMAANHRPIIRGTDFAIWRRIMLIPFEVRIPEAEQDHRLSEKLQGELAGILSWCVRGCLEWQQSGLCPPQAVKAATEGYRHEQDAIGRFLEECCEQRAAFTVCATELYLAYKAWSEREGERVQTQTAFGSALTERGLTSRKVRSTGYRDGVRLLSSTLEID